MRNADVIAVSTNHWAGLPTSKQHLMSILARDRKVLYVDPPIDFFSVLGRRRRWSKLKRLSRISDTLSVMSPVMLAKPSGPSRAAEFHRRMSRAVSSAADDLGLSSRVLWTFAPEHVSYVGRLEEEILVYHAADEPASFVRDHDAVRALEAELMERADLIFVSSEVLLDARSATGKAHLLSNAADARHFRRVVSGDPDASAETFLSDLSRPQRLPEELRELPRPIVMYGGAAYDWFDAELFQSVASMRPDWTFIVVGPVARSLSGLGGRRNIHLLGRKSYEEYPWYVLAADVAVIPWRDCLFSMNADPIVLYEYLLCGKQVVATGFPAAKRRGDLVATAASPDEFVRALDEAVSRRDAAHEVVKRVEFGLSNTWEDRATVALGLIDGVVRSPKIGAR